MSAHSFSPKSSLASPANEPTRILVVEDNDALREAIVLALAPRWPGLIDVADGDAALTRIRDPESPSFHVVLCDLHLPGASGDTIQPAALERDPDTAFLLMTADASVDSAVSAMAAGAFDFIQKPFDLAQLEVRVARAVEHVRLRGELSELRNQVAGAPGDFVVANSPSMQSAVETAQRVSREAELDKQRSETVRFNTAHLEQARERVSPRNDGRTTALAKKKSEPTGAERSRRSQQMLRSLRQGAHLCTL